MSKNPQDKNRVPGQGEDLNKEDIGRPGRPEHERKGQTEGEQGKKMPEPGRQPQQPIPGKEPIGEERREEREKTKRPA